MKQIKMIRSLMLFATTLLLQLTLIPAWTTQVQAQSSASQTTTPARRRSRVTFKPRKGERAPKITVGGGRRNNGMCEQSTEISSLGIKSKTIDKTLVPLLPSSKLGLTASSHPTVMVHVPPTSAKALEFTLENEEGEGIYQTEVNIEKTPGIISFTLPKTEPGLEIDKDYRFVVAIICQQTGPRNPFVEGLVRRIPPDSRLMNQQDQPKSLDQVMLYGKYGYWIEAAASLAALKRAQPDDSEIAAAWDNLLESVGLNAIAKVPLQD